MNTKKDSASPASAALRASLIAALSKKIPNLETSQSSKTCGVKQAGQAHFAYIYHQTRGAAIRVYCFGEAGTLLTAVQGSRLQMKCRDGKTGSWAERFPCHFRIENEADIEADAKLLHNVSFRHASR